MKIRDLHDLFGSDVPAISLTGTIGDAHFSPVDHIAHIHVRAVR